MLAEACSNSGIQASKKAEGAEFDKHPCRKQCAYGWPIEAGLLESMPRLQRS